jgi:hypothetical protein
VAALHGDFRRQPAAEGQSDERDLLVRERLEDIQIKVHQIVHGLEFGGTRREPEARVRRRDDLEAAAEQIQKPRLRVDGLHTVQQQNRPPRAPAQDVQLHATDRQPLRDGRARCVRHDTSE